MVHTENHPQVHLHVIIDHNPGIDITMGQPHATKEVDLDHNHTIESTTAKDAITPVEHILAHTTETIGDLTEVAHTNSIPTVLHTTITVTPHIEDPPLIEDH